MDRWKCPPHQTGSSGAKSLAGLRYDGAYCEAVTMAYKEGTHWYGFSGLSHCAASCRCEDVEARPQVLRHSWCTG